METKSRYEVIAELETKKRDLIRERESFPEEIRKREINLRNNKRVIEDNELELKDFKESVESRKKMIQELIESIDASLGRFNQASK